jgi:hypothetical protein
MCVIVRHLAITQAQKAALMAAMIMFSYAQGGRALHTQNKMFCANVSAA